MHSDKRIIIQDAVSADAEGILRVQKLTWLATYPNQKLGITIHDIESKFANSEERLARWKKTVEECGDISRLWVAKDGGQVVGFCFVVKREFENEIGAIYVLPEYQNQGIGREFFTNIFTWFGSDKSIVVGVASYNTQAIAFYRQAGFVEKGSLPPTPAAYFSEGKYIPEIQMIKVYS